MSRRFAILRRLANSRAVVRIVPYPACALPGTAPTSHWLDASSTKGDTWDRGKQILYPSERALLKGHLSEMKTCR